MTDHSDDRADGARMCLEPDAFHEHDGESTLDCPACGSPATVSQIVEAGRCSGHLGDDVTETEGGQRVENPACTAELSLELVWNA